MLQGFTNNMSSFNIHLQLLNIYYVRQQKPTNEDELQEAMNNVRNVISVDHCNNYVANTNRNCQMCLAGQDYFEN